MTTHVQISARWKNWTEASYYSWMLQLKYILFRKTMNLALLCLCFYQKYLTFYIAFHVECSFPDITYFCICFSKTTPQQKDIFIPNFRLTSETKVFIFPMLLQTVGDRMTTGFRIHNQTLAISASCYMEKYFLLCFFLVLKRWLVNIKQ